MDAIQDLLKYEREIAAERFHGARPVSDAYRKMVDAAAEQYTRLTEENTRLREALEPFAKDEGVAGVYSFGWQVCANARAALVKGEAT